jgi:hypothetical protein
MRNNHHTDNLKGDYMASNKSFYLNDSDMNNMETIYKIYKEKINIELTPSMMARLAFFKLLHHIDNIQDIDRERLAYLDFQTANAKVSNLDIAINKILDS